MLASEQASAYESVPMGEGLMASAAKAGWAALEKLEDVRVVERWSPEGDVQMFPSKKFAFVFG